MYSEWARCWWWWCTWRCVADATAWVVAVRLLPVPVPVPVPVLPLRTCAWGRTRARAFVSLTLVLEGDDDGIRLYSDVAPTPLALESEAWRRADGDEEPPDGTWNGGSGGGGDTPYCAASCPAVASSSGTRRFTTSFVACNWARSLWISEARAARWRRNVWFSSTNCSSASLAACWWACSSASSSATRSWAAISCFFKDDTLCGEKVGASNTHVSNTQHKINTRTRAPELRRLFTALHF